MASLTPNCRWWRLKTSRWRAYSDVVGIRSDSYLSEADMASDIVYLNGEFMPLEAARLPVLDRGFIFGDGVYEVVPAYSRHPFRLAEHLKRLQNSLDGIRLDNPLP